MRRLRKTAGETPSTFFDGWTEQNDNAPADRDAPRWRSRRWRVGTGVAALVVGAGATVTLVVLGQSAGADPSAHTWHRLRMCESSDNYSINTGNGYYGAYQFDLSTWQSVGGSGYPNQAWKGRAGRPRVDPLPRARLATLDVCEHPRPARGQRCPQRANQRHQDRRQITG